MKKIYYLMMAMLMAMTTLSLTACGDDDEEDGPNGGGGNIEGTWKGNLTNDWYDEEDADYIEKAEALIQFKKGGKYVSVTIIHYTKKGIEEIRQYEPNFKNPQVEVDNGTYSVNGNKLTTFDSEGERDESTFSISGKKLTITYIEDGQEVKMTLTRVDDKEINKYL